MGSASSKRLPPEALPQGEALDVRRRRQLIDATIRAIARHGLSGTTVARVAGLAGLSTGIVNFYFQTKDALLLATLQTVDEEFAERQREALERAGEDPVRQLEAMIEVDFDPIVSAPERVAVWNAFWGEAGAREDYMRICGRREQEDAGRAVELFRRIAARGGYRHIDPKALGRAFYHLLSSMPEEMLDGRESFDPEAAKATCRSFLASIFPAEFGTQRGARAQPTAVALRAAPARSQRTLPPWVYRDPELHELEMQAIFRRHWLLVGHVSELTQPGAYLTLEVGGELALVIRGADDELRGFHNVCRHRASRLVGGASGRCDGAIECPAHGWCYDLQGRLADVPDAGSFPGLDRSRLGLPPIELAQWMGFVYLRFESGGPALREEMRPFDAEARRQRLGELRFDAQRWSRSAHFDWKLFAENVAAAEGERIQRRLLPTPDPADAAEERVRWVTFPGGEIAVGPDRVDACQVLPLGPQRCRIQGFRLTVPDERGEARAVRQRHARIARRVLDEQLAACAEMAAGLGSSSYRAGPLSERDSGLRRFQDRIRELVPVTRMEQAPPPGSAAAHNEELRVRG